MMNEDFQYIAEYYKLYTGHINTVTISKVYLSRSPKIEYNANVNYSGGIGVYHSMIDLMKEVCLYSRSLGLNAERF